MVWVILSINNKGGTGKSTIAKELSYALKDEGYDVGVMDADIDSANLASRFGADEKVTFTGDHIVEPVEHDGFKIFSMENAFSESTFSQSGDFMRDVIDNMINNSNWGELDYMVVDCPPGSSDVFSELVRGLRPSMLGAISVGISDAVDDTARLVKVCNHNWIPIIGFIENMRGISAFNQDVTVEHEGKEKKVYPFGHGKIERFADELNGQYLGAVPLCVHGSDITDEAPETIDNMVEAIEEAEEPPLPEDNLGDKSFIRNVWGTIREGVSQMSEEYDVDRIQNQFGVQGRDPLIMSLKLTDAGPITGMFDEVVLTVQEGEIKVMRPKKAKRAGLVVEGGMEITSQDLYDAIRGEKKVMRSVTGEITTEPYSITKAVQMGDAEVWGDKTVNRLAVLDKILSDVVDMDDVRKVVDSA